VTAAEEIEEVVVTGSLIKRDSFDMSTPLDVMDEQELAEQGTPNLGDVLRNSTYNFGVESVGNILAANPQTAGFQGANFRGLGVGATLTLLDGRRVITGNLANTYPQILIQRTEALTDGGATLYGTDAVGGVFNVIPKKNFEGIEIQIGSTQADQYYNDSVGFLIGGGGDSGNFVLALEQRKQDSLRFQERPHYWLGSASYSSTSWPGDFVVANRGADGSIVGAQGRADPGCGLNNKPSASPAERKLLGGADVDYHRQGILVGSCRWEFGRNFDYFDDFEAQSMTALYDYTFSDSISLSGELMYTYYDTISRGSPSNPGGRIPELSAVPGDNPGNPYRAFYDVDQDGRYDAADGDLLLFAQDLNNDGVPDRNDAGLDVDQNGMADVIVVGDENNPNGGIPFNEDVLMADWRPVGYPFVGPSRLNDDRTSNGAANGQVQTIRSVTQIDFDINDSWGGYASYTYSKMLWQLGGRSESLSNIEAGIQGTLLVRDEATSGSRYAWFNPFTTQNYACVNRDCSGGVRQTDPDQINTTDIYDQIAFDDPAETKATMKIYEMVLSGDVFDMPTGAAQLAVGIQYRDEDFGVDSSEVSNALDLWIGVGAADYNVDRQTTALFGEVLVPVLDTLEVDLSARTEKVDDSGTSADLDHTDFRIGARFAPLDMLSMRASYNTSFIAPSFTQLYAPPTLQGLSQITDPFLGIAAFTARTTGGTTTLRPEEADSINLGATVFLLDDDLRIDFDYKIFDFKDRIIRPAAQEVLLQEAALATAAGYTLDAAGLAGWIADPSNPGVTERSPINQQISLVYTDQINAQSMEWKGFDLSVNYSVPDSIFFDGDFGQLNLGVDATFTQTYDYTSVTGVTTHGAGKRNNNTAAVPPTPDWKMNFRTRWNMGNHQVVVYGRYYTAVSGFTTGDPFAAFCPGSAARGFGALLSVTNGCGENNDKLKDMLTFDIQYTLTLPELISEQDTQIQLGLINAFDEQGDATITLGGAETHLVDPRDQMWYVRVKQGF
jgi:outer membrane receptor protein involved in Fe transport